MASTKDSRAAVETVWRRESARVVAALARLTRDVGLAEDLAQETLLTALEKWPDNGVPDNPGAWLVTTGKRRALDHLRKQKLVTRKHGQLADAATTIVDGDAIEKTMDDEVGDDVLRLIFIACHPILSTDARVALTLRMLCGLTTDEIARAYLTPSATLAQRIVRAKRVLSEAQVPFELPSGDALFERTAAVLRVVYLVFNEGYAATAGDDIVRPALCDEALRLGRLLLQQLPKEPEVHGLLALMEIQASRAAARVDADGQPVLLLEQDRSRWDRDAITRGLALLARAHLLGGRGPYVLQAEIAACHGRARRAEDTDWARIAARYAALAKLTPSPVIDLNRAIAVSMAEGPAVGLELLDDLADDPQLSHHHLLPAARADMLEKLGRNPEAKAEFERAAAAAIHPRERALMLKRAARCDRD